MVRKRNVAATSAAVVVALDGVDGALEQQQQLTPLELDRRERNRSKVRRSYYRKIYNINELRAQVDVLEDEYARILLEQEQRAAQLADAMATSTHALAPTPSRAQRLRELAQVRKTLYDDNAALRALQMDHDKAHGSLQHLVDLQLEQGGGRHLMANDSRDVASVPSDVTLLRPFTIDECLALIRDAYARIVAYNDAQRLHPPAATVLGWTDRRHVADGAMSFCFHKVFTQARAVDLADATWRLLMDPSEVTTLYSPFLNVRFSRVQQIDFNNVILYRTFAQTDVDVVQKSLLLLTRFEIEQGEMLLLKGLDPTRVVDNAFEVDRLGKRELWQDVFTWVLVEPKDDGCAFSFGGDVNTDDPSNLFWFIEVLLIVLRWETHVVGPLFHLT